MMLGEICEGNESRIRKGRRKLVGLHRRRWSCTYLRVGLHVKKQYHSDAVNSMMARHSCTEYLMSWYEGRSKYAGGFG